MAEETAEKRTRQKRTALSTMEDQLEAAKERYEKMKTNLQNSSAEVDMMKKCVEILKQQQPTPTIIPASAANTAAKSAAKK